MKKLEFKTSNGEFILVDSIGRDNYYEVIRSENLKIKHIGFVKDMTEDQFSEVVDISFDTPRMYRDYVNNMPGLNARQSFETLIASLGYYLFENPINESIKSLPLKDQHYRQTEPAWVESENKTFYNPILIKKI